MIIIDQIKKAISSLQIAHIRTGTKITIYWLVFSGILIAWLTIGIPILSIFYPHMVPMATNISSIITALVGGSAVAFATSETRKTVENVTTTSKSVKLMEENPPPRGE